MDIDMDLDLGADEELSALEAEAMRIDDQATIFDASNHTNGAFTNITPSSESVQSTPHKVHVRGLDNLTSEDITAFATEHFPSDLPTRIEWVDDTSANLVYSTPATALKALAHFSLLSNEEPSSLSTLQLRAAKISSKIPDSRLQVRLAVMTDVKKPRASESSRFYLLHPEFDPKERRRREGGSRRRKSTTYEGDNREFRSRRYDDREHRRRRDRDEEGGFSVNLYDDDSGATSLKEGMMHGRRDSRSSYSSSDDRRGSRDRRVHFKGGDRKELLPDRMNRNHGGRLRNRSASPEGDRAVDGDMEITEVRSRERNYRQRRLTPPPPYRPPKAKELFPSRSHSSFDISADLCGSASRGHNKELFPRKATAAGNGKELFPNKTGISNHRRSDAIDTAADDTADLFASGMSVPFTDGASENRPKSRNLADRITKASSLSFGRLNSSVSDPVEDMEEGGFSIRGAAKQQDQGFSIRGAATTTAPNGIAKELFPGKLGDNAGKELFAEKRGGRRQKAEDMFY
ncbi:MAG: hypothetical protein M1827_000874 [Pycnora praestabilis]|nr:MAG: hypothetical protein M1827_000874 [Pycnora praestabilis]